MENKYIVYKNDYNKLCNYGLNDVNSILDSYVDDYISSNNILIGGLDDYGIDELLIILFLIIGSIGVIIGIIITLIIQKLFN